MGGLVVRAFRNFNVEGRAHRLIGKEKPAAAPRHPTTEQEPYDPAMQNTLNKKDDRLLSLLKDVYVDSTDPPPLQVKKPSSTSKHQDELRPPKLTLKQDRYSILDVENIPKGKISIVEALTALSNHKHQPDTWTAEKTAEEYSLELKDTRALLEFFRPFDVKLLLPTEAKQINST